MEDKKSQSIKSRMLGLMDRMEMFGKKYPKADLPVPSDEFVGAKTLLEKAECVLGVVGKVKAGKTSLINALIGYDLLPVATDVATAKAFLIKNAPQPSFYVVYANSNRKEISQTELAAYGSQEKIDEEGSQDLDQVVAYIEVNVPMPFLQEGTALLDLPGIGSMYPHHTEVTKSFMNKCDAVMFVTNPTPLEDVETDFMKEIAELNPNLLFVATKADNYSEDVVADNIANNKALIEKTVGNKLYRPVEIWPMSSVALKEASEEQDRDMAEFSLRMSGFDTISEAIDRTLSLTRDYFQAGMAYDAAMDYYKEVSAALANRLSMCKKSIMDYEKLKTEYEEKLKFFNETFTTQRRQQLREEVDNILNVMQYQFNLLFAAEGTTVKKYEAEIDDLTEEDIKVYGSNLGHNIIKDVQDEWNKLTVEISGKIQELTQAFYKECMMNLPNGVTFYDPHNPQDPKLQDVTVSERCSEVITKFSRGGILGSIIAAAGAGAFMMLPSTVAVAAIPIVGQVFVLYGLGSVLWAAISGNASAKKKKLAQNKAELKKYLYNIINHCKRQLVEISLQDGKHKSLYQAFVESLRTNAMNTVDETNEKFKKELKASLEVLNANKQDPGIKKGLEFLSGEWNKMLKDLEEMQEAIMATVEKV